MAEIRIDNLRHNYLASPKSDDDFALKRLSLTWQDGGAYALLGPSGCGKTTLLNLISGLLTPTEGTISFNGRDVSRASPEERNIAQVFQFPVIYDTMTVYDNLAFPLRNRGVAEDEIRTRVAAIADMLELTQTLGNRAAGLTADGKQKISLGRGLVRSDVNVIMFDEPLTVIDPHLKWQLRSKLKELHQRTRRTMIYVTHDQTEALTFADQVVVMNLGEVVQAGTPVDLFERPQHTFVGHFIGSPGMNVLPCEMKGGKAVFAGTPVAAANAAQATGRGRTEIGVRPEFVTAGKKGIAAEVVRVADAGRFRIVETRAHGHAVKLLVKEGEAVPEGMTHLAFDPGHTQIYEDGWMAGVPLMNKIVNNRAWWLVLPVFVMVAFNALIPLMTVVNYSVQETFGNNQFFWSGTIWFEQLLNDDQFHDSLVRQIIFTTAVLVIQVPLGLAIALCMPRKGPWVSVCLVLMSLPLLVPWNVVGSMWNIMALPDIGLLGKGLNALGIPYNYTRQPAAAWFTVILMDVWHWTSLVVLLCYAGLVSIPDAYYQAAKVDGARPWAVFRYIQLPKLKHVLTIAILLRFMDSFMIYTEVIVLTGGGPGSTTKFLSIDLVQKALGGFDLGPAAAFSIVYFLIILLLSWLFYTLMMRNEAK